MTGLVPEKKGEFENDGVLGQGFDLGEVKHEDSGHHIGIASMRERARVIGGKMDIWSKVGEGTRLTLWVELKS